VILQRISENTHDLHCLAGDFTEILDSKKPILSVCDGISALRSITSRKLASSTKDTMETQQIEQMSAKTSKLRLAFVFTRCSSTLENLRSEESKISSTSAQRSPMLVLASVVTLIGAGSSCEGTVDPAMFTRAQITNLRIG
jgi:gamma-glutamyl-gamma-aminobutyrate hydrolase PuuD